MPPKASDPTFVLTGHLHGEAESFSIKGLTAKTTVSDLKERVFKRNRGNFNEGFDHKKIKIYKIGGTAISEDGIEEEIGLGEDQINVNHPITITVCGHGIDQQPVLLLSLTLRITQAAKSCFGLQNLSPLLIDLSASGRCERIH